MSLEKLALALGEAQVAAVPMAVAAIVATEVRVLEVTVVASWRRGARIFPDQYSESTFQQRNDDQARCVPQVPGYGSSDPGVPAVIKVKLRHRCGRRASMRKFDVMLPGSRSEAD